MSTRIALEIAAELDFEDGVVCREAAAVIRAQHSEIERLTDTLTAAQAALAEAIQDARLAYDKGVMDQSVRDLPGAIEAEQDIARLTAERAAAIAAAVAAEREACAKIADRGTNPMPSTNTDRYAPGMKEASALTANAIAKTIRAREKP